MDKLRKKVHLRQVSPYTGEWIEISLVVLWQSSNQSHLTQVSGLKYHFLHIRATYHDVSPYTGEWIEIGVILVPSDKTTPSHLTQVSGLKLLYQSILLALVVLSHLTQVSGLKSSVHNLLPCGIPVSPYTGEWIEIFAACTPPTPNVCLTLHR